MRLSDALARGRKIRRKSWPPGHYVELKVGRVAPEFYHYRPAQLSYPEEGVLPLRGVLSTPHWWPTGDDNTADDWEVMKQEAK